MPRRRATSAEGGGAIVPHTHARSRQGAGGRRRHEEERALDWVAKRAGVVQTGQTALANLDAPPPRWAHELAQELERDNVARCQLAFTKQGTGYVPPLHEPWRQTTDVIQRERDRLVWHLMAVATARDHQLAELGQKAATERTRAGLGRFDPVPARRLGAMLMVMRHARRRHPEPVRPRLLPLAPGAPHRLHTVRMELAQRLHCMTTPSPSSADQVSRAPR